jgi:hypothetical protein
MGANEIYDFNQIDLEIALPPSNEHIIIFW